MNSVSQTIRLFITDDHKIFRNGLIASLQPYSDVNIIGQAESGEELLQMLESHSPDVVLIDMKMTGLDGIETTGIIKQKYPQIKVIGLSVYENHHYIINMFKAGANGYLLKDSDPDEIVNAIKTVMETEYYFNRMVSVKLLKNLLDIDHPSTRLTGSSEDMTEMETEVLKLICKEYTNPEIAEKLNLGSKTVENYRYKLLNKTGAKNTAGLVMYAIKKGYIVV